MSGTSRFIPVVIGFAIVCGAAFTALQPAQRHASVPVQTAVYRPAGDAGEHAGVQIQPVRWYGYGYRPAYYRPYWYGPRYYSYYRPYYRPYYQPYVGYYRPPRVSFYLGYYPPVYSYPLNYYGYSYPAYGSFYW